MTSESTVYLVGVLNGEHFRLKGKLLPVSQKPNLLISVESIVSYSTVVSHGYCQQYRSIIYAVFTGIKKLSLDKWQTLSQGDFKKHIAIAVCSFLLNRLAVTHTSTDTYPIFCILSETNKLLISQFKIHQELNLQPRSTFTWVRKTQRYKTGKTKAMNKVIHSSNTRLKNYHKNTATHWRHKAPYMHTGNLYQDFPTSCATLGSSNGRDIQGLQTRREI